MNADVHEPGDFIAYPTHRVVGTIAETDDAHRAIDALLSSGFAHGDIDVLHGKGDLHRLDPSGTEHGFFAQFQRTMIRLASPAEEFVHLSRHVADVRAGRFVVMVLAKVPERRQVAADILIAHGAEFVGFYGPWAYEGLDATPVGDARQPPAGRTFEVDLAGVRTRLRVEPDGSAAVSDPGSSSSSRPANVTVIRPGLLMLSWPADGQPVVGVVDFEHGTAFAVANTGNGRQEHQTGTVRPLD